VGRAARPVHDEDLGQGERHLGGTQTSRNTDRKGQRRLTTPSEQHAPGLTTRRVTYRYSTCHIMCAL
jgi:hypothetical protein